MEKKEVKVFTNTNELKTFLATNYLKQINNFFGDEKKALKFMSSVMADVSRNPKLIECSSHSIINSYITMAQLGFMPSGVSGESYVLPYNIGGVMTAQFQMGYQGLVTLFYQAGVEKIYSDIVRKNDKTTLINGVLKHKVDITKSNEERGEAVGAYVKVTFKGIENTKYMNAKDILALGTRFSKSFDPAGKYSPWNPANDPELHMWRKTVLKQFAKILPKNENINRAIYLDNADSVIADRLDPALEDSEALKMGNLLKSPNEKNKENKDEIETSESMEAQS